MARSPRAKVSKTSGQGVSRLSYQRGYALKGGRGDVPKAGGSSGFDPSGKAASTRNYAKAGSGEKRDINVEYGEDQVATRVFGDIENYAREKPPKGLNLTRKPTKDLK